MIEWLAPGRSGVLLLPGDLADDLPGYASTAGEPGSASIAEPPNPSARSAA